jgi:hypothetical protein
MALWHDPLDELIADLERALPPVAEPAALDWNASWVGCQLLIGAILYGTPEDVTRIEQDSRVTAFWKTLEHRPHRDALNDSDGRAQ